MKKIIYIIIRILGLFLGLFFIAIGAFRIIGLLNDPYKANLLDSVVYIIFVFMGIYFVFYGIKGNKRD